jgi:REP element-mobilizing transposase RayT
MEKEIVGREFGLIVRDQKHSILAATVQATHVHLVFAPLQEKLDTVIARLKRRSAAAVLGSRRELIAQRAPARMAGLYSRPILGRNVPRSLWTAGKFPVFIFDETHLFNAIEYVRDHNRRIGLPSDPFDWIDPLYPPGQMIGERFGRYEQSML